MSVVQNSWRGTAQKRRVSSRKTKLVPVVGDGSDMDDKSNPLFGEVLEPEAPAPEAPKTEQVTYTPGPDDPTSVKWHGYTFHANVPKAVANADLVERARGNKFFKVGEFTESDVVTTREEPPAPKTAEQYRAHAVAWFKQMQSVEQLDTKWQGEETLRMSCGVGSDDLEYLGHLSGPLRAELRKRDMA